MVLMMKMMMMINMHRHKHDHRQLLTEHDHRLILTVDTDLETIFHYFLSIILLFDLYCRICKLKFIVTQHTVHTQEHWFMGKFTPTFFPKTEIK
jgi:hypothetical protein